MESSSTTPRRARELLDAFLVDNEELERLNARLAQFNVFSVLRIESAEIRHSNVLAWMLSPSSTHGLGDLFLRRFLSRLLRDNELQGIRRSAAEVELMPLDDIEVLREWHSIDLTVRSRSQRWCLLIENKILSSESPGQLSRYHDVVLKEMDGWDIIPVFLTLHGNDPSDDGRALGYVPLGHASVLDLVERVLHQNRSRVPEDARVFLDHYCETLRRLTMEDQELTALCKQIYRKHREAIDLIVDLGASSQVLDACLEAAASFPGVVVVPGPALSRVWFLTEEMASMQREVGSGWKFLPKRYAVMWWFLYRKNAGRLQLSLEVGPVESPGTRQAILEAFRSSGFKFWEGAFRPEAKYTRVFSVAKSLGTDEEGEVDTSFENAQKVAAALWKKAAGDCERAQGALEGVSWPSGPDN